MINLSVVDVEYLKLRTCRDLSKEYREEIQHGIRQLDWDGSRGIHLDKWSEGWTVAFEHETFMHPMVFLHQNRAY